MAKVQSQLLVSLVTRQRADAIALIRQEPRAEVYRIALEGGGLKELEKTHAAELKRLAAVAETFGMVPLELAERAVADGYTLADLEGRKRYPAKR